MDYFNFTSQTLLVIRVWHYSLYIRLSFTFLRCRAKVTSVNLRRTPHLFLLSAISVSWWPLSSEDKRWGRGRVTRTTLALNSLLNHIFRYADAWWNTQMWCFTDASGNVLMWLEFLSPFNLKENFPGWSWSLQRSIVHPLGKSFPFLSSILLYPIVFSSILPTLSF